MTTTNSLTQTEVVSILELEGNEWMSSVQISLLCDKRHDNILRDIRKLVEFYDETYSTQIRVESIKSSTYIDDSGKSNVCYLLSRDASLDLVTGYSLPHRHAVNKRWLQLEAQNSTQFPQDYLTALEAFVAVQREKERLAKEFIKASNEVYEKTILLENSEAVKARLEHTIDHHIQVPKAVPLESSEVGVYTNQEIEDLYKGHIALDKVKRCLEYLGHPTIKYQKEITTGRGLTKHTVSRVVQSYSKEVDIAISLQKAFYPDADKISEYEKTTIRFTGKSMEVHNHPASQYYLIRIPKETAIELFALTDDFFVPSKDFYDYLDFVQKGELTIVTE